LGGIAAPLAGALLGWSEQSRRDLPWRRTRDPWAVLVSELMLQQTQVARVVRIYPGFMARFPEPASCARAPAGAVIEAWSGLGYNRRALNLHRIATTVVDRHGGQLPDTIEGLMALPGVGPYTARAVSVFAFEAECGVVDTNAWRVLARAVAGSRLSGRDAQALADGMVPPGRAWAWNQAVLDLGATVCVSGRPRCGDCPVARHCRWHTEGGPDPAAGSSRPQPAFDGSDRQGRGRLVQALRRGPVSLDSVATAAGWPHDRLRAERVAAALVAEGLAIEVDRCLSLP
jgi:A/G-specific adenine glycosylase